MIIDINTGSGIQKSFVYIVRRRYDSRVTLNVQLTQPRASIGISINGIDDFAIPYTSDICNEDVFRESLKENLQVKAIINRFFIGKNKNTPEIIYGNSHKEFDDWINGSL